MCGSISGSTYYIMRSRLALFWEGKPPLALPLFLPSSSLDGRSARVDVHTLLSLRHKRATSSSVLHVTQKHIFSENDLSCACPLPSLIEQSTEEARGQMCTRLSLFTTRELPLPYTLLITQNLLCDSDTTAHFSCLESTTLKPLSHCKNKPPF